MNSTGDWWKAEIDWSTPAGQLLKSFLDGLPPTPRLEIVLYGSSPLQLTVDATLLSGDIDLFATDDSDLSALIDGR